MLFYYNSLISINLIKFVLLSCIFGFAELYLHQMDYDSILVTACHCAICLSRSLRYVTSFLKLMPGFFCPYSLAVVAQMAYMSIIAPSHLSSAPQRKQFYDFWTFDPNCFQDFYTRFTRSTVGSHFDPPMQQVQVLRYNN